MSPRQSAPDLEVLHAHMRHQARMYLDLQKTRIGIGNRIGAIERDAEAAGTSDSIVVLFATKELREAVTRLESAEHECSLQLQRFGRQHPLADFVAQARGMGMQSLSVLIGLTGPLSDFATVSKLWRFCGMDVENGHAPRREKGGRLHHSPAARVLCHQLGDSIVKVGGEYRALYDAKKAEYKLRERIGPSECPFGQVHSREKTTHKGGEEQAAGVVKCGDAHIHNAAMRYAVKRLLRNLWVEWRRVLGGSQPGGVHPSPSGGVGQPSPATPEFAEVS